MKSLKYTLAISLLAALWPAVSTLGCWGSWFLPNGYYMYRVSDTAAEPKALIPSFNPDAEANCLAWQRYTSPDIPLTDIYQVVYKMSLTGFEAFCEKRGSYEGNNAFLRWLSLNDAEVSEFLLFAKTTEDVRSRQNSRWYYPSMRTSARMTLEEIAETALAYRGRLRDRYLLQAVRALFSLHRYEACIALWEEVSRLPEKNIMRRMILPYIAGAEYRMKHYDKAVAYFCEAGDYASMIACSGADAPTSTVETIERIYRYAPNCRCFPEMLQKFVRVVESDAEFYREGSDDYFMKEEHRQLIRLAVRIAQEGKTVNPTMWYYTAAFLEDLDGHPTEASRLLSKAEQACGTAVVKESVQVMRIYLDAKLLPYNRAYEQRLLEQLQWLDRQIVDHLTPQVREQTAQGRNLQLNISYYYWNDMLRRILLGIVCPRMIEAGKPVRALQLANMADNRLLNLVDCRTYSRYYEDKEWSHRYEEAIGTLREFRRDKHAWSPDYSNSFFELIDSLGVRLAMEYHSRVEYPRNAFDRFLNARGYVDRDYLNDIVGTQCLRTMRYQEAVTYLGAVSRSFEGHLNTSISWDTFAYERRRIADKSDFKYRFSREMWMLEQEMTSPASDPDRKAGATIRYAVGLQNSFGRCWSLTQYYRGTSFYGQLQEKRDWENEPAAIRARHRARELIRQACSLFTDRELAAKNLYAFHQFRTVAEKYPDTETGRYVRSHCDNLCDYVIEQ